MVVGTFQPTMRKPEMQVVGPNFLVALFSCGVLKCLFSTVSIE